jgi:hypothetical protein
LNGWGIFAGDTAPAFGAGQVGNCGIFGGISDAVTHTGSFTSPGTSDFTMSCWINTSDSNVYMYRKWNNIASDAAFLAFGIDISGVLRVRMQAHGPVNGRDVLGNAVINDGQWHFVGFTRSGATINVYVDNALDKTDTGSATTNITDDGGDSYLGAPFGATAYYEGNIDDFRLNIGTAHDINRWRAHYANQLTPSTFYNVNF